MTLGVRRSREPHDVAALEAEVAIARGVLEFGAGTFAHSLSLPLAEDIAPAHRDDRNNTPYAGALDDCPAMKRIFDGFAAEKAAFRLLQRAPGTAYGLHDDRDKGDDVLRFQIPITSNDRSLLVVQKDDASLEALARAVADLDIEGTSSRFDFDRFERAIGRFVDAYRLEPGYLYRFDTNLVHTVVNAGTEERIVLSFDLLRNEWLDEWVVDRVSELVRPVDVRALPPGSWDWSALSHGLLTHPRVRPS